MSKEIRNLMETLNQINEFDMTPDFNGGGDGNRDGGEYDKYVTEIANDMVELIIEQAQTAIEKAREYGVGPIIGLPDESDFIERMITILNSQGFLAN